MKRREKEMLFLARFRSHAPKTPLSDPHTYSEWLQFIYLSSSILKRPFGEFELPGSTGDKAKKLHRLYFFFPSFFLSVASFISRIFHLFFREDFQDSFSGKKCIHDFFPFLWVANIFRAKKHPFRTEDEKKYLGQWVTQWHLSNRIVGDNTPFPQIIFQAFQQLSVSLKNWSIYLEKKEFFPLRKIIAIILMALPWCCCRNHLPP